MTVQLGVAPLPLTVTVTVPFGVPAPDATVKRTVNWVPLTLGSGVSSVMVVVVPIASSSISFEVTWA